MPKVSFKTIDSVDVSGKRVLVRVDLNVPMKNGQVTDATRIERAAPTLAELAAKGAKVSTKIDLLENLVHKVDALVIGGGMANTFLHAQGVAVGKSLAEKDLAATALKILDQAKTAKCTVLLPVDVVVSPEFKAGAPNRRSRA